MLISFNATKFLVNFLVNGIHGESTVDQVACVIDEVNSAYFYLNYNRVTVNLGFSWLVFPYSIIFKKSAVIDLQKTGNPYFKLM